VLRDYIFKDAQKNQFFVRKTSCPGAKEASHTIRARKTKDGLSLVSASIRRAAHPDPALRWTPQALPFWRRKILHQRANRCCEEKYQALYSYRLNFAFSTDAGLMNYLRGREFSVPEVDFAKKYFDFDFSVDN
jgi:23S rRNA pseudouridine955/2504/2580 synthase